MNAQSSENLGAYLRTFLQALNRQAAVDGPQTFSIEVLEDGFRTDDIELLQ